MRKELIYLCWLLILFASCEEKYVPNIEAIKDQLVVEAKITNEPSMNFVHLTKTRNFEESVSLPEVSGATVKLIGAGSAATITGYESAPGYYTFLTAPESGKQYFLRINIQTDIYESMIVTMPPLPTFTNLRTEEVTKTFWVKNGDGIPQPVKKLGRELYVDLPVTSSLGYYRFDKREIVQWSWDSPYPFDIIPTAYGWYSYVDKESFHLAAPKDYSETSKIDKYPLDMITYNPLQYLYSDTLKYHGMILIFDQYGTSKESYDYHTKLNSQFAANGSLFDPIQNQIVGNIICKTNPSQIVYGFFDLNSYQQFRYFYLLNTPPGVIVLKQLFRFPVIPLTGMIRTAPIQKGLPMPEPISPPAWWEE